MAAKSVSSVHAVSVHAMCPSVSHSRLLKSSRMDVHRLLLQVELAEVGAAAGDASPTVTLVDLPLSKVLSGTFVGGASAAGVEEQSLGPRSEVLVEVPHLPDPSETLTLTCTGLALWWEEPSGPLTEAEELLLQGGAGGAPAAAPPGQSDISTSWAQ